MRKSLKTLSLVFILALLGCSRGQSSMLVDEEGKRVHEVLLSAEQLANEHPDSVLSMIWRLHVDGMEPNIFLNDSDRTKLTHEPDVALFGLLYTEAIHKKGMTIKDDTLIARSLIHYEQTRESERLCKALIHRGVSNMDNGRLEQAVDNLKRAETLATDEQNDTLIYDANMALGQLNQAAACNALMTDYYKRSLTTARKMSNNERIALSLNSLMRAYLKLNQTDSADVFAESAELLCEQMEPAVQSELLASMGTIKLRKGQRDEGKAMLQKALQLFPCSYAALKLGNQRAFEGDTLKACDLWAEALQSMDEEVMIEALQQLVGYYENHEQWRALDLSKMLNGLLQNVRRNGTTERVAELQAQYDHRLAQRKWHLWLWIVVAICGVLLLGCWLLVVERRRRKRQYDEVLSHIAELQERLDTHAKQQASAEAEEKNRQEEQERNGLKTLLDENLVYWFHRKAMVGKQPDYDDWSEMQGLFEKHQPLFLQTIGQHEDLSERDMHVCMLIRLRFQPTEIAALIGASPQTVTNRRTWMLSKLFGEKGGARDFDRRIQEMNK
ncbi:MAG: hypothetical protein K5893_01170 [Prevotella sp.]|nr:hypothetical protein [Prevotella sp.]